MAEMGLFGELVWARFRWIYITSVTLIVLIGVQETLSARGARFGGGFRSSSARYSVRTSPNVRYTSHSTRVRVRYNNYRPWRSWHSYGSSGYIYGYVYYTRSRHYHLHKDREPTICRNEYDNFMDNGTNYEWFICPNTTNPDNYDACCGDEDRQYCCQRALDGAKVFGIFVAVFIFLLGIVLTIYCCCCRKPSGRETYFQERFMSKRLTNGGPAVAAVHYRPDPTGMLGNAAETTYLVNSPVQGPQPTFPQKDQPCYAPGQPCYPPVASPAQPVYPPQPVPSPHGYANDNYPSSGGLGAYPSYPSNPGAQPYPASDQLPFPVQPLPPSLNDGLGYPPYASAPPYTSYQTDGSSAPPYPPYPVDSNLAAPYPSQPAAYNPPGYSVSPPPTYSSLK